MQNGIQIGIEMAEKKVDKQTDRHFRIYNSRDKHLFLFLNERPVNDQPQRIRSRRKSAVVKNGDDNQVINY